MDAILFDMDGVVYEGNRVIDGARETIEWVQQQNIPHLFVTNTSSQPRYALVEKLAELGITIAADEILTPPIAALNWLKSSKVKNTALFVAGKTQSDFSGIQLVDPFASEDVDAVVLGDLGTEWSFETYNRIFRLLMGPIQPPLIALGLTRYWMTDDGLQLDVGPFIKGLEYASGTEAIVMGKPAAPFFRTALAMLGSMAEHTYMIGDDIKGDIDGAQEAGLKGLLVKTGKYRHDDLDKGIVPFGILNTIADLPAWWDENVEKKPG